MGNAVYLNSTDCDSADEAYKDNNYDKTSNLKFLSGEGPALFWLACFRIQDLTKYLVGSDRKSQDYFFFTSHKKALSNLESASSILKNNFKDHPGAIALYEDFKNFISDVDRRNICLMIPTYDWWVKDPPPAEILSMILNCFDNKSKWDMRVISYAFELKLYELKFFKKNPIPFYTEDELNEGEYPEEIWRNTGALVGFLED